MYILRRTNNTSKSFCHSQPQSNPIMIIRPFLVKSSIHIEQFPNLILFHSSPTIDNLKSNQITLIKRFMINYNPSSFHLHISLISKLNRVRNQVHNNLLQSQFIIINNKITLLLYLFIL